MPMKRRPRPVARCDEHDRYFFWKTGCGPDTPIPTETEVRAYYDWARTATTADWKRPVEKGVPA